MGFGTGQTLPISVVSASTKSKAAGSLSAFCPRLDAVTTNDSEGGASVAPIVARRLPRGRPPRRECARSCPSNCSFPYLLRSKSLRVVFNGTKRDGQDPAWIIRRSVSRRRYSQAKSAASAFCIFFVGSRRLPIKLRHHVTPMLADEQVPRGSYDDFRCTYQHLEVTSKQYGEGSFTLQFRRFFFPLIWFIVSCC
jgi:hypothetical protein